MIEVVYHRDYHRVTVDGHAESGEAGHDLVCASASILAYTLAGNVVNLSAGGDRTVRNPHIELSEGHAEISCTPVNRYRHTVTLMFDSVCVGFDLLGQKYPDFIKYEVRG